MTEETPVETLEKWSWRIVPSDDPVPENVLSVRRLSDTHPDVIATLLAEYLTDTILRIDGEARIDLNVMLKADLIVVMGEVDCSHPAKGAIIHSDQFSMTLNSSMRDVLRTISGDQEEDPVNAHIIITIEPSRGATLNSVLGVSRSAHQRVGDKVARLVEERILKLAESTAMSVRGLEICVSLTSTAETGEIDVSFTCEKMNEFVAAIASCFVDPSISNNTIVNIRNINKMKLTGKSYEWAGKDWTKRFGYIFAKIEANQIGSCIVKLNFDCTEKVRNVQVFGTEVNVEPIQDRIKNIDLNKLKTKIMGSDPHATFFALKQGGSSCNPEYLDYQDSQ